MKFDSKTCTRLGIVAFAVVILSYFCISKSWLATLFSALLPIIIGGVFAYIINILVAFYEHRLFSKKKGKKSIQTVSLLLAVFTIILFVALMGYLVIPQFVSCISTLIEKAPKAIDWLLSIPQIESLIPENIEEYIANLDWNEIISKVSSVLQSGIGGAAESITAALSSAVSVITSIVFGILFASYFLIDRKRISNQITRLTKRALAPNVYENITHVCHVVNESFHKYIVAQCLEAIILGTLCVIGMLIIGLPYALMIGALVGITALIPIVGGYIGEGLGVLMILSESPKDALIFFIFILVLQTIESNLIAPKVVGSSIGLPSVWVLAAVTVGGSLMGITGMLLGVPIASAIYKLLREFVNTEPEKAETAAAEPMTE
ncbi:MAG: AI-2E family transporter [Eubacterium sp.]|nr:AI-2E family transporter [Eubacterium sp.]